MPVVDRVLWLSDSASSRVILLNKICFQSAETSVLVASRHGRVRAAVAAPSALTELYFVVFLQSDTEATKAFFAFEHN